MHMCPPAPNPFTALKSREIFSHTSRKRADRLMHELREWIADVLKCDVDDLPPEHTRLADIEGWDSLRHVSLIVGLEKKLNKKLTAEQIRAIVTFGDVVSILKQKAVDA